MAKKGLIQHILIICLCLTTAQTALAEVGSSANYILDIADTTNANISGDSSSYGLTSVIGDNLDDTSSSGSYTLCSGFVEEVFGACAQIVPPPPEPEPEPEPSTPGGSVVGGRPVVLVVSELPPEIEKKDLAEEETEETIDEIILDAPVIEEEPPPTKSPGEPQQEEISPQEPTIQAGQHLDKEIIDSQKPRKDIVQDTGSSESISTEDKILEKIKPEAAGVQPAAPEKGECVLPWWLIIILLVVPSMTLYGLLISKTERR